MLWSPTERTNAICVYSSNGKAQVERDSCQSRHVGKWVSQESKAKTYTFCVGAHIWIHMDKGMLLYSDYITDIFFSANYT